MEALMIRNCAPFLALAFAWAGAYAQSTAKPEFEVASIKPSPPYSPGVGFAVACRGGPETSDPSLFVCENYSHLNMVLHAYGIEYYQLSAPDWMLATRFDLRATVPEGAQKEQLRLMLQNLLADRFKLKVHHELRDIQRYELKVARGGSKFKESKPAAAKDGASAAPAPLKANKDGYPMLRGGMTMAIIRDKARAHWPEMTMEMLAAQLSGQLGGPVIDATGLTGKYDIDLYWSAVNSLHASAPAADPAMLASDPSGPTLQQALQDQLGLRLESKKGPVDFLVVDHMEEVPTAN
jgi:uncharacterized protein (TIGR03435 family)